MTTSAFVNAQLVEDRVRLLYRDEQGVLKAKSMPAEWVTYHPAELDPDPQRSQALLGALRNDRRVLGVAREGDYHRVRWRGKWERRDVVKAMRDARDEDGRARPIPVLEGDVHPVRRLVSDLGLGIAKPRRLFFDIETDSRVNFAKSRMGEARVLSWAAIDQNGNEFTAVLEEWTDEAEATLLEAFWALAERGEVNSIVEVTFDEGKVVAKARGECTHPKVHERLRESVCYGYDQLIAWSGRHGDETYDFLVMEKRSQRVGAIPKDLSRWLWLDHHDVFERMNKNAAESGEEKQSLKLQDVGMALLGFGKDDFLGSRTYEAWLDDGSYKSREDLRRYNLKDVRLMLQIEEKSGYIAVHQALCEACGIFPNTNSLYPTVQMDGFMLRLGAERGIHFRTKYYDREEDEHPKEQFEGAFVLHPKVKGVVHDVHVGDFAGMYPSIIITWNMSPDTKVGVFPEDARPQDTCRCPGTGVCFSTKKQGILAYAIAEMIRLRSYWRDMASKLNPGTPEWVDAQRRSTAYKVAANSFFGAMGNRYARYYDEEIAESITTNGSWLAKNIISHAETYSITSIYGDTDATMATGVNRKQFAAFVDHCNGILIPKLLESVGCKESRIKIENEKGYKRIVFMEKTSGKGLAAKRYAAVYSYYKGAEADASSEPEIKGLAWRRGDANKMARDLQWDVVQLFRDDDKYADEAAYVAAVEKWRHHVLEEPLTVDEVKVSASLTKELDEYVVKVKKDGTDAAGTPHVRVAKMIRARGGEAMLGTRIEYFTKDHPSRTILPVADYDGECDRYHLWETKVYKPSITLLEAIIPGHDWKQYASARPKKARKGRFRDDVATGAGDSRGGAEVERGSGVARQPRRADQEGGRGRSRRAAEPALGRARKQRRARRVAAAHESFPCGVCGDEVEVGDSNVAFDCPQCCNPIAAHEMPCARKGAVCLSCAAPPRRKKRVVAA